MSSAIRLFVSHSADDVDLAARLIDLLRAALNLPAPSIRCTSVDGYRLPGGADSDEQLRLEVHAAEAFIGIVSAGSLRSLYVLFELGARWGVRKHLIPLLSPGSEPAILGAPLAGLNALRADSRAQLQQLVTDIGAVLNVVPEGPAVYDKHISSILEIRPATSRTTDHAPGVTPDGPAPELTVTPYDGPEAILYVQNNGGDGLFTADAQIVAVLSEAIGHPAPYRMLWRDTSTHKVVKGHECLIRSGGRVKLLLAKWESGGEWGKPSIAVIGDEWKIDHYRHDPWDKRSPLVTIQVEIKSVPPLRMPFTRHYSMYLPAKTTSKVLVVEAGGSVPT